MTNIPNAREVDLHNHRLMEAELVICDCLEEIWCTEEPAVLFIHGYHNGVAIKSFIRSPGGLRAKWSQAFSRLPPIEVIIKDEGCTYVRFIDEG